jgi:predicted nuclease of predicted toxin-antitoxin system
MLDLRGQSTSEAGRVSLLFDQNLSWRLVGRLAAEYPGSEQVVLAGLAGADDRVVWAYAASKGLAVVTKDSDFSALSALLGSPPKLVWLHVGNGPTQDVEDLLRLRQSDVSAFLADPVPTILELP